MLNTDATTDKQTFNQTCSNTSCNSVLIVDGDLQDTIKDQNNEIILRSMSVIKIDKGSGKLFGKCKKCKSWNTLRLDVNI